MSLSFTSTNRVDGGNAAVFDDAAAGTILAWINMTSFSGTQRIWHKTQTGTAAFFFNQATTEIRMFKSRATTALDVTALNSNCAGVGSAKWIFVACTWDTTLTNADQKIFTGDRNTLAAEPSAYATQGVGSGAITTDAAGNPFWGNSGAGTQPMGGLISVGQYVSRQLTLGEIRQWQWRPRWVTSTEQLYVMGWNGTTNVPDLSGNARTGTITGATVAADSPVLGSINGAQAPKLLYVFASAGPTGTGGSTLGGFASAGTGTTTVVGSGGSTLSGLASAGTGSTATGGWPDRRRRFIAAMGG